VKKILLIVMLVFNASFLFAQKWLWGVQPASGKANVDDEGWALAKDNFGNMYVTGWFGDTAVFGKDTLKTAGNSLYTTDVFLAKYDENGNALWAKQSVGEVISRGNGYSVATDKSNNVYVTGYFQDTINFGPYQLKAFSTYFYVFLVKYDSNGNVLWAKQSASTNGGSGSGVSVSTDSWNNVFVTGNFQDNIDFGTFKLTTPLYGTNVFLTKYDSNGNVLWATAPSYSTQCDAYGYSVTTDVGGNAYITGSFENTASFGSNNLTSSAGDAYFIAKYSPSGNVVWAKQSYSSQNATRGYAITTDATGYIYATGIYSGSAVFGATTLPNTSKENTFLARYDTAGNIKWVKSGNILDNNAWIGYAVTTDMYSNSYIAVGTNGTINCEIQFGSDIFKLAEGTDPLLLVKYDSAGNELCGTIIASGGDDFCGIAADKKGNLYVGGDLEDTVTLGADKIGPLPGASEWVFLAKWQPCNSPVDTTAEPPAPTPCASLFIPQAFSPNKDGNNDVLYVLGECIKTMDFIIYDRWGNKVFESTNINYGWDGSYKGQPLNTGSFVYYFKATMQDGAAYEKKGSITLVR
jgi:gliding motility-associated-like protein